MKMKTVFIKPFITIAFMCSSIMAMSSDEWAKIKLSNLIESKVQREIKGIIPAESYILNTQITLSPEEETQNDNNNPFSDLSDNNGKTLLLDKYGFWDDLNTTENNNGESDIFSRITNVQMNLTLDDRLEAETDNIIRQIITRSSLNLTGLRPRINIERQDLAKISIQYEKKYSKELQEALRENQPKNNETPAAQPQGPVVPENKFYEFLKEFKNPIGALITGLLITLILGLLIFNALKRFSGAVEKGASAYEKYLDKMGNNQKQNTEQQAPGVATTGTKLELSNEDEKEKKSLENFAKIAESNPEIAAEILKKWVRSRSDIDSKSLKIVQGHLSPEQIENVFNLFSNDMKISCQRLIKLPVSETNKKVYEHINESIIHYHTNIRAKLENGVNDMIDNLTVNEITEHFDENFQVATMLLRCTQQDKALLVMKKLDRDYFKRFIIESAKISDRDLNNSSLKLYNSVEKIKSKRHKESQYLEKITEAVPHMNAEKESLIYSLIVQSGNDSLLEEIAHNYFPSKLLFELPSSFVSNFLNKHYPDPRDKAKLVVSQNKNYSQWLLDHSGNPESKARAILQSEINDIKSNAFLKKSATQDRDLIWADFIQLIRSELRLKENQSYSERIISQWVKKVKKIRTEESTLIKKVS